VRGRRDGGFIAVWNDVVIQCNLLLRCTEIRRTPNALCRDHANDAKRLCLLLSKHDSQDDDDKHDRKDNQ